ncbi:hypothetical protein, partial [Achromobacter kerstersii]|uniref:hypothetical protein n=1 Tax=Achromobacter kerstersii TaxID=1353890 RepID=UPI003209343F
MQKPLAAPAARGFLLINARMSVIEYINGRIVKNESPKTKPHRVTCGVLRNKSLTMTYFHRRPSTIIGAKAFH